jgi:hypothetical protein
LEQEVTDGLVAPYRDFDQLLCEEHFFERFEEAKGACGACGLMLDGKIVPVGDHSYHRDCLKCGLCGCTLTSVKRRPGTNQLVCDPCYDNQVLDKCPMCNEPLKGDVVELTTTEDITVHEHCVKCHDCGEDLMDGFKCHPTEAHKIFCQKHWNARYADRCAGCKKSVQPGQRALKALGRKWHAECFTCSADECTTSLAGVKFRVKEGKPYCQHHYDDLFLPKCFKCTLPLKGKYMTYQDGHDFEPGSADAAAVDHRKVHHDCLTCAHCDVSLIDQPFVVHGSDTYCEAHYLEFVAVGCDFCGDYIYGTPMRAFGKNYHKKCFSCATCKVHLDPDKCHFVDGSLACKDHAGIGLFSLAAICMYIDFFCTNVLAA